MQYLSQRLASSSKSTRPAIAPSSPVAADQRERLLDAAERLAGERGCSASSIEAIVAAAHVSSATFYEHFADKEACFAAALDRAVAETAARLVAAVGGEGEMDWADRVRVILGALLAEVESQPARARLCLVEAQTGGPALLERYEAALDVAARRLRGGRALPGAPPLLPDTVEEAAVGGIAWLLRRRLEAGEAGGVADLLPELTEIALSPYG